MLLSKEQIEAGAKWWADVICSPKFDNGDPSINGGMAFMLASMNVKPVTEEQKQKFVEALRARLSEDIYPFVSVDYHPGKLLAEALDEAGISRSNSPWKTDMCFDKVVGEVHVRYGYTAPWTQIYPVPAQAERA